MAATLSASAQPSQEETKFARALVHPEKPIRDETLSSLHARLGKMKDCVPLEMMKLWKALYYCMWLADKRDVQEELAQRLADILDVFRNDAQRLEYLRSFFRTILREWTLLDLHRMNKFYFLIRVVLRKILLTSIQRYTNGRRCDREFTEAVNAVLWEDVLSQRPNGVRNHVCDIFLTELSAATAGVGCSTTFFLLSLQPFFKFLTAKGMDAAALDRADKSVLQVLAAQTQFESVRMDVLQAFVFDLAANDQVGGKARRMLYAAHAALSSVTARDFVDAEVVLEQQRVDETIKAESAKRGSSESATSEEVVGSKKRKSGSGVSEAHVRELEEQKSTKKPKTEEKAKKGSQIPRSSKATKC